MSKLRQYMSVLAALFASSGAFASNATASDAELMQIFDPSFYAANNPDVVAVFGSSFNGLFAHWKAYGIDEGRTGSVDFDQLRAATIPALQATCGGGGNYPNFVFGDLRCMLENAVRKAPYHPELQNQWHYLFGFGIPTQGQWGTAQFSPWLYLMRNPDVDAFCRSGPPQLLMTCARKHYIQYGRFEGRSQ